VSAGDRPAVVLDGSANAVSVARSLGSRKIAVYALGDPSSPVRHSRFCRRFVAVRGQDRQAGWLDWLERERLGAVVLPCGDHGLELVARNRARLIAAGYLPVEGNDEVLLALLDKQRTYELARELGIRAPETVPLYTRGDLERALGTASFPCVLKPIRSHDFQRHSELGDKVVVARDRGELEATIVRLWALGVNMLLTEVIPGPDDRFCSYYTYLDERGEPLFHLTKRKIRQFPTGFGLGCYHVTDWNPEVAELGLRFFQGVGVRGLANVEFKRDVRDDQLKLVECNSRFTAADQLIRKAGVDLPLLVYNRLTHRPLPSTSSYRRGLHLWYPIEDTRAFLSLRRAGELSMTEWLRSLCHRQQLPVFSLADPMPTVAYNWGKARRYARRRRARASGQGAVSLDPE
jgi:predicted ATP-grasp superfamily ATP-dependent carboligase